MGSIKLQHLASLKIFGVSAGKRTEISFNLQGYFALGGDAYREALELVGLDDMKNKLVKNMTEYDKKKLALAVALLGNPDILLLDEPISSRMSAERREGLCAIIKMLGRIKPVVITTGDFKLARGLASDVVIISDGRVLAKGSFEALEAKLADSASPTTLEALYNSLSVVAE